MSEFRIWKMYGISEPVALDFFNDASDRNLARSYFP
jgi:hypothetical protein